MKVNLCDDVIRQPKFLTKEERAAEAIRRRQEQVDAQRRVLDEERKKQDEFMKAAKESAGESACVDHESVTVHFNVFTSLTLFY